MQDFDPTARTPTRMRAFPHADPEPNWSVEANSGLTLFEMRWGSLALRYARRRPVPVGKRFSWVFAIVPVALVGAFAGGAWRSPAPRPSAPPVLRIIREAPPAPIPVFSPRITVVIPPALPLSEPDRSRPTIAAAADPDLRSENGLGQSRPADFALWPSVQAALGTALDRGEVQDWSDAPAFGVVVPGEMLETADSEGRRCRTVAILKRQEGKEAETRSGTWCVDRKGAVVPGDA
ncbi:MAG: hypothetical protein ABW169_10380 [Sphingobium sp.]